MSKVYIELHDPSANPGNRRGSVLNKQGEVIGEAHDSTYRGSAFAVHTTDWAGHTALDRIEFVVVGYLATMGNHTRPFNHGKVLTTSERYVVSRGDDDDTPVEDFGMYIFRQEPFPPTGSDELFDIFRKLLAEQEGVL